MMRSFFVAIVLMLRPQEGLFGQSPAHLSGEISADRILNGESAFPPSPSIDVPVDLNGLDRARLGTVPPPGVHPRVLISPDQLPDLRRRLRETNVGRELLASLQRRIDSSIRNPDYWGSSLYELLATGRLAEARAMVEGKNELPPTIGHYQPFLYAIVLEAFDALIQEDRVRGERAAVAVATYADLVRPAIDASSKAPLHDDVWRPKASDAGPWALRDALGGHLLGYAYDFSAPFMNESQRKIVRGAIAAATNGRVWMGARLPRHFRNWNWIAVGLQQPLLALAIEGEEGYDPRVYRLGVEMARDYLTYGISPMGVSTEAVGYTQFGLVWANPFFVAAQRRGADLLGHGHHRAMLDWYLHTTVPTRDRWLSQGDGGDGGPAIWTLSMWRYFFPSDAKAKALWRSFVASRSGKPFDGNYHLIEAMIWAADDPQLHDPPPDKGEDLAALAVPPVLFDPDRGWLTARSAWDRDAAFMQFECRVDSVGASHEHADRGSFTFAALGRVWAKDNFRSVETRHHNSILIDGLGQGYWPGPGVWLGLETFGTLLVAACDARDAYSWFWPKQILTEDPERFERFRFPRWAAYESEARAFQKLRSGPSGEKDPRAGVVSFWKRYESGDPRLWDEDGWPVRFPHNTVARAFRTIAFERGRNPWLLVVDDIQKDNRERLYEWLMQTGLDTEIASIAGNDIVLCDASVKRDLSGNVRPAKADRCLLVRILNLNDPDGFAAYQSRPSVRLETFERRDTLAPESSGLAGSRSFGLDKRLVIPSRSKSPDFQILLYPFRHGDPLPETSWNDEGSVLTIRAPSGVQRLSFTRADDGRTHLTPSDSHHSQ
ncbi:MAG: hypothetical protein SFU53_15600 [Terrimicrobiaceae bacterium]|nr:hypothetical protein [Terrimicrobiaceae bacterium]